MDAAEPGLAGPTKLLERLRSSADGATVSRSRDRACIASTADDARAAMARAGCKCRWFL